MNTNFATNRITLVGDKVLYVNEYADRFVEKAVVKVTKAGWIRVEGIEETFKPHSYQNCWAGGYKGRTKVYPNTPENVAQLNKIVDDHEKAREEKRAAEAERQARIAARDAEEMAKVRAAVGNDIRRQVNMKWTFPDGSRLYVLNVPVAPEHSERKKGFEVAIVRVKEEKQWGDEIKSRAYHSYTNGNENSFASCSGFEVENDEDALWQVAKELYNRG